jgi:hypothetical protein
MKRLLTLSLVVLSIIPVYSQIWFDIGAKGTVGTSFWINSNTYKSSALSPKFNVSWGAGGRFGVNFGEGPGVVVEGMFGQHGAGYKQSMDDGNGGFYNLDRVSKLSAVELNVMFRWLKNSTFVEIGPSFNFVTNATDMDDQFTAPSNYFNKIMYGATFGLGGLIVGNEKVGLMLGFKVNYNFSDLISEDGRSNNYQMVNPGNNWEFSGYKGTHPLSVQVTLEINYSLGYLVRASCGKRTYLLGF